MRILFVGISGYNYPHTRVRCFHFARELSGYSHQTEVLSFRDHLAPAFSEAQMYGLSDRWKLILAVKALKHLLRYRGQVIYLQKIHYHAAMPFLLTRLGFFKLVFDLDDWDEHCLCLFSRPILNRLFFGSTHYGWIVQRAARMSLFNVAASHSLVEILKPFEKKTYLLHTGVDSDRFTFEHRPDRKEILCGWTGLVWGETIYRSVLMMIKAFADAWQKEPRLRLKIIGGGQMMPLVTQALHSSYGDLPVTILDWIHPDSMVRELHSFDIGLLPFVSTDDEDLVWIKSKSPTKFFEYLATGLPTVATNIGEVSHIIENGKNGFLVSSPEEMSKKIVLLARDPDLRVRMGREARETIENNYNLTSLGRSLADIFAGLEQD